MGVVSGAAGLVLNTSSGGFSRPAGRNELSELLERHGVPVQAAYTGSGDPGVAARTAIEQGASLVIAAGGDGTVNAVATVVAGSDASMAVLPMGTLNHFAKDMGIPEDLEAAAAIIAAGNETRVDIGEVNGRAFVNNSSLGFYPRMLLARGRRRNGGHGRMQALFWAGLNVLRNPPYLRVRITSEEQRIERTATVLFVGNNGYQFGGKQAGTRRSLNGGHLVICLVKASPGSELLRLAWRAMRGRLDEASNFESWKAARVLIETRMSRLPVSLDGEVLWMDTPLEYRLRPLALRVVVPAE